MSNDMISYNDIENVRENPDNVPQTYKDEDQWPLVLWQNTCFVSIWLHESPKIC